MLCSYCFITKIPLFKAYNLQYWKKCRLLVAILNSRAVTLPSIPARQLSSNSAPASRLKLLVSDGNAKLREQNRLQEVIRACPMCPRAGEHEAIRNQCWQRFLVSFPEVTSNFIRAVAEFVRIGIGGRRIGGRCHRHSVIASCCHKFSALSCTTNSRPHPRDLVSTSLLSP